MEELEFDILEECYFVINFDDLREEVMKPEADLKQGLNSLLAKKHVQQMYFDRAVGDYVKKEAPDFSDLANYSYLATKEGLLAHNT